MSHNATMETVRPCDKQNNDCEGICLQNGGLTLLLISFPSDSTTVCNDKYKQIVEEYLSLLE